MAAKRHKRRTKALLVLVCTAALLGFGFPRLSSRLFTWYQQKQAIEYVEQHGWQVSRVFQCTNCCEPSSIPLTGYNLTTSPIEGMDVYSAAFKRELDRRNITLDPGTHYTVFWIDLSDVILEEYPDQTLLRTNVLMDGSEVVCATLSWSGVLHTADIIAYADTLDVLWPHDSFSHSVTEPGNYYPIDWTPEQIRAYFDRSILEAC